MNDRKQYPQQELTRTQHVLRLNRAKQLRIRLNAAGQAPGKLPFTLAALLICFLSVAQTIPSDRMYDWSQAGFKGTPPGLTINLTQLGAPGDGSQPIDTWLQQALESLSGRAGVIYFPAGTYLLHSSIHLPDSTFLRGAGADSTHLVFDLGGAPVHCISISRDHTSLAGNFTRILSGLLRNSSLLMVADAQTFEAGCYAEIRQQNGSWDTRPASYAQHCVGQIVEVKNVSGNILEIEPPLRLDLDSALHAEIRKLHPVVHAGVECMKISRADSSSSASAYQIYFGFAVNGLLSGIESFRSMGAHVMIEYSKNITVTGSYFHHAWGYDGSGTRGYGVCLRQHASDCLIENNIFEYLRHAMMVKEGANGNVFIYNYSREPTRSEPISDFTGDISLHGHYAFANLFEGNVVQNIIIDHIWGPSGPYNTFFRNRVVLYGILMTGSAPFTSDQNFVANVITNPAALYGSYLLSGTGHFEYGNSIKGNIVPAGTDSVAERSLYFSNAPSYWDSISWPSIGPSLQSASGFIPALLRYSNGHALTQCISSIDSTSDSTLTSVVWTSEQSPSRLQITPNPAGTFAEILVPAASAPYATLIVTDLTGKCLSKMVYKRNLFGTLLHFEFPESFPAGWYIFYFASGNTVYATKIFKTAQSK
ncbi:MAG: hypothetical protein KatS3mg031_0656 [Chitinophagales bacterium]|nr:MAG: hypothetical protein KatS3mg031_0656 [Chitinophagales bacterium]